MATAIKDLRVQHNKINEQNKKMKDAKATAQKVRVVSNSRSTEYQVFFGYF